MSPSSIRASSRIACLFLAASIAGSAATSEDFEYIDKGNSITITHYFRRGGANVVIPSIIAGKPVTEIGAATFRYNDLLQTVSIPATVTVIGAQAFENCIRLQSVSLSSGVTAIETGAFARCYELGAINLPSSITRIATAAFEYCQKLRSVAIPGGLTTLEANVFLNCSGLETVALPAGLTALGSNVFFSCGSLKTVALPAGLTTIGEGAFEQSGLTSVTLPGKLTSLGNRAFSGCKDLENVQFEGGLDAIGSYTFHACSRLKSLDLPKGVERIGDFAFAYSGLKTIGLEDVREIGVRAFSDCQGLTRVVFPKSVRIINDSAFERSYQLSAGVFEGNAPNLGKKVFAPAGPEFKIIVSDTSKGFTVPRWNGYGVSLPGAEITVQNPDGSLVPAYQYFKFATMLVNRRSADTAVFTIRNVGNRKLNDLSASISGGSSGDFTIKSPIKKSLAPGQATKIQVTFTPENAGKRRSALFIRSSDGDEPAVRILLSGLGVAVLK